MKSGQKIRVSALSTITIWLFTLVLPVVFSLKALNYFNQKYSEFAKAQQTEQLNNKITQFNELIKPENALQSIIKAVQDFASQNSYFNPSQLHEHIEKNTSIQPLFILLRDNKSKISAYKRKFSDIKHATLPGGILFREFFSAVDRIESEATSVQNRKKNIDKNKRRVQQLFRTLTPVTLLYNQTARNYSYYLGGEIYLQLIKFAPESTYNYCLVVVRGKEITSRFLVDFAKKRIPDCNIALKTIDLNNAKNKGNFVSGTSNKPDQVVITAPADQSFIRHFLHEGGISIKKRLNPIPFTVGKFSKSTFSSPIKKLQTRIVFLAKLFLMISGALMVYIALFGLEFSNSLKYKVIGALMLVSIFPFSALIASLYLYKSYDIYNFRLNLKKHVETRINQSFEEIHQSIANLETYMMSNPELLEKLSDIDKKDFEQIAENLSKKLPFSEVSYVTLKDQFNYTLPERQGVFEVREDDPVWIYLPTKTLKLLKEENIKNRTPQHIFYIHGQPINISFLGDTMQAMGNFFLLNQGAVPIWVSSAQIPEKGESKRKIKAIITFKYDLGPILKNHYDKGVNFTQKYTNTTIDYGYFPLTRLSDQDYWKGTFAPGKEILFENFLQMNQNQTLNFYDQLYETTVFIRTHQNYPHKAIAVARTPLIEQNIEWQSFATTGVIYLLAVFIFVSGLLDYFLIDPVSKMARTAELIARGKDSWELNIDSGDELAMLNLNFISMVKALKQRNILKDYVSKAAYSDLSSQTGHDLFPGGEYQELTVVFASFREYSELLQKNNAKNTIAGLNRFITLCDEVCQEYKGAIDKLTEGTAMMVFRETEGINYSHALQASKAILKLRQLALKKGFKILAGLASGKVISGRIGSYKGKLDFTVIGDTVNLAARLKNEAFKSNTGIVIAGSSVHILKGKARINFLRRTQIKGKSREFNIYELIELR